MQTGRGEEEDNNDEKRGEYMYGAISQRSFQRMKTNKTNEERGDVILGETDSQSNREVKSPKRLSCLFPGPCSQLFPAVQFGFEENLQLAVAAVVFFNGGRVLDRGLEAGFQLPLLGFQRLDFG
jgi:hypothetical protein